MATKLTVQKITSVWKNDEYPCFFCGSKSDFSVLFKMESNQESNSGTCSMSLDIVLCPECAMQLAREILEEAK